MDAFARQTSPYYTAEHEAFRDSIRRWVAREVEPYAADWDEAGSFPRELYKKASEIGLCSFFTFNIPVYKYMTYPNKFKMKSRNHSNLMR